MQIILADHHPQSLWALKTLLQEKPEFEIVGEVDNAADLLALAEQCPTELVLVDWELPGQPIEGVIDRLHGISPRPTVVVMGSKPEYGRMLLKAGADAFVSKGDQPDWLIETLLKFAKSSESKKEK
jgi:DNA-binding NarL/FixJ family response regulator